MNHQLEDFIEENEDALDIHTPPDVWEDISRNILDSSTDVKLKPRLIHWKLIITIGLVSCASLYLLYPNKDKGIYIIKKTGKIATPAEQRDQKSQKAPPVSRPSVPQTLTETFNEDTQGHYYPFVPVKDSSLRVKKDSTLNVQKTEPEKYDTFKPYPVLLYKPVFMRSVLGDEELERIKDRRMKARNRRNKL